MTKQLIKTFDGIVVKYDSNRKQNNFIVTRRGKVVERYSDYLSCIYWIMHNTDNFERMQLKSRDEIINETMARINASA